MSSVSIESLFDNHRLPHGGLALVIFIAYLPIGLVLAFIRVFIGFHVFIVSCILPKTWHLRCAVMRVMCAVLGIVVVQENSKLRDRNAKVIVANYTTLMDRIVVELVCPNVMFGVGISLYTGLDVIAVNTDSVFTAMTSSPPSMWDLPAALMWLLGYEDMGAKRGRETLVQNAKQHCQVSPYPLLAFPECATTNSKVGLLKFSVWPFSLDEPVQPISMRVLRPSITPISASVAGSWWWTDVFWFLFVPYTSFTLRILTPMRQLDDETPQEFSTRVQKTIANALSVVATSYTSADKMEHIKRNDMTQRESRVDQPCKSTNAVDSEMELLMNQVKQVLPHVPAQVIRQDLCLTKDIDLTITNILEGKVSFKPEEPGIEADRTVELPSQSKPTTSMATSFGRTSSERHMTFVERKKAFIETARQRYLEKHNNLTQTSPQSSS